MQFANFHFVNMSIRGLSMKAFSFRNCTFSDCIFACCYMESTSFTECSFYSNDFDMCDFENATFEKCTINGRFTYCWFVQTRIENCNFKRGFIRLSNLSNIHLLNSLFDGTWAASLQIWKPVELENIDYTMGGATRAEMEAAMERFLRALHGNELTEKGQDVSEV